MMSIYQSRPKRPINDFAGQPTTLGATPPLARSFPRPPVSSEDCAQLRKAKPVNYMLPISVKWFESLPVTVRPRALVRQYPRIANLIALQWNNAVALRAYFDDLLTDHRGTRKGFPADVFHDLQALRKHYYSLHLTLQLE